MPVAERLRPYVNGFTPTDEASGRTEPELVDDLMQRAVVLLTVMPRSQHRETIVKLISPYDPERGSRAVDALVEASLIAEDAEGRLRRR